MATPKIRVRGIRSPVLSGHVIGRRSANAGDAELIPFSDLAGIIAQHGQAAVSGGGGGSLPTIASGDLLGNASSGSATAVDTVLSDLIDRALGSTQGDILYRDSAAWKVLGPGTSGQFLQTQGASANPQWATPGGGGGGVGLYSQVMAATPTQSGTGFTTQVNSGVTTPMYSDGLTGVAISAASNSSARGISHVNKTAPSTGNKTATALIALSSTLVSGFATVLFGYSDGVKFEVLSLSFSTVSHDSCDLQVSKYTNKTTFSAAVALGTPSLGLPPLLWCQAVDDGTNAKFYISYDGANFSQVYTTVKSTGFLGASGYSKIIFGIEPFAADTIGTLMSYAET